MAVYVGPASPHRETPYTLDRDSSGWPVFALQRGLRTVGELLAVDGDYGPETERVVKRYQFDTGLKLDGRAGPATQRMLIEGVDQSVETGVPVGLMRGFAEAEGGNLVGAVNWSQSGGVDCGIMQIRVYGPPYSQERLRYAFAPGAAFVFTANQLLDRYESYRRMAYAAKGGQEFSLRCASLAHNWPFAAEQYARFGKLPNPDRRATWVPEGVKFPDGAPVITWKDWAQFYAMGGIHGEGRVTRYVTNWGMRDVYEHRREVLG